MLLIQEYKINWLKLFLCSAAVLACSILMSVWNCGTQAIVFVYEIILPMVIAIYCSHLIFDSPDLEILFTCGIPFANIVFCKYFMYIGMVLLLGVLQLAISAVFQAQYAFAVFFALIPSACVLSSISLLTAIIFKSTGSSAVITSLLIGLMLYITDGLAKHLMPQWLHYINFFETFHFYGTAYWLPNRIILLSVSFVFGIASYVLLRSNRLEYIKNSTGSD